MVHDDGSLKPTTCDKIISLRPHWTVINRRNSDVLAHERLGAYRRFLQLRERHPLAVKMADAWLWAPNPRYIFIDSDCLFFQRPQFILDWVQAGDDTAWFMREYQEVYSYIVPLETLDSWTGKTVFRGVNTGICLLQKALFNWPRVEEVLSRPEIAALRGGDDWYIEQTLCAILLTDWNRGGLLPAMDYRTGYDVGPTWEASCTACHYVGPTKSDRYYYHGLLGLLVRYIKDVFRRECGAKDS